MAPYYLHLWKCTINQILTSTIDSSWITCAKIINAADSLPKNGSAIVHMKVKYKMDCYILHLVISDHITIDNCYHLLSLQKTKKHIDVLTT